MVYAAVISWLLAGLAGFVMMRQGFLVDFEKSLGKEVAWDVSCIVTGVLGILAGPFFMLIALLVKGGLCFRKRPK